MLSCCFCNPSAQPPIARATKQQQQLKESHKEKPRPERDSWLGELQLCSAFATAASVTFVLLRLSSSLCLHCLTTARCFIYKTGQKLKHIHEFIHDVSTAPQVSGLVFCFLSFPTAERQTQTTRRPLPLRPAHTKIIMHLHTHERSKCLFVYASPTFVYV